MKKGVVGVIIAGVFVALAAGLQVSKERPFGRTSSLTGEAMASVNVPSGSPEMSMASQVVVYYFHGNARCPSCYKLEQYAKESLEQNFAQELKMGQIVFKKINIDQPQNNHFVNDYQLYTKSVVLSLVKEGKQVRHKNLDRVWDLLRDPKMYHDYVRDEVAPFLGEL